MKIVILFLPVAAQQSQLQMEARMSEFEIVVVERCRYKQQLELWEMSLKWTGLEGNEDVIRHIRPPAEGYEGLVDKFKPSVLQYFLAFVGNCPCCWCCC